MSPQARLKALTEELKQHNYQYYVLAQPTISDQEFDLKLKELEALEAAHPELREPDSPTLRVGGAITKDFPSFVHLRPMLSLNNSYSREELADFDRQVIEGSGGAPFRYLVDHKFDGVSLSLHYENGILVRGVTRGDGVQGDEITANAQTIHSVPLKLRGSDIPAHLEVRGEVIMPLASFASLNESREAQGLARLMNPRNTTAGTLKMQDSSVVASRDLVFYAYYVARPGDTDTSRDSEYMDQLQKWGFKLSGAHQVCPDMAAVYAYLDTWEGDRQSLGYEIDGIVIKVDELGLRAEIGYTAKAPKWAIAFKYKAEAAVTVLESVSFQVGRTGKLTPVANLAPVLLAGTTVKRASIHNADEIARLDLHIGDQVAVEKGGEIIPKITEVLLSKRPPEAKAVKFPTNCPFCDTVLIREAGEANHYCPNVTACPPQVKERIIHFASRKSLDIEGLGTEIVSQLVDAGLVHTVADLYDLNYETLIKLERFADLSVRNLLEGIEKSKEMPFAKVLFALGIRFVGATVAKKLARHLGSMAAISKSSVEELEAIPDIGTRIAESLRTYFEDPAQQEILERLQVAGLQFEEAEKRKSSDLFSGKSFVISGVFSSFSREALKQRIEDLGGEVKSSLSSKTSFFVAGEKSGPSKLAKAAKLNIPVLSEADFLKMI